MISCFFPNRRSPLLVLLSAVALSAGTAAPAPDRATFATQERPIEQVPVDAFELGGPAADELKIEIWAQSPLLYTPVSMDMDPQGRMWLTEGLNYNAGGRIASGEAIIVVSDTDQDGKADKSQIFTSEKGMRHAPLGIAVFDNRIVLSATPNLIVYTDVNRNGIFDDGDSRDVLLSGFAGGGHDHTLHAVVGGPSGQWYFSFGNMGCDVKTPDGRRFLAGCYYGNSGVMGQPSSDGHVYMGGVAMRMNPDGTGLSAIGCNMRNTQDMTVSSMGDVFHSDNDDPAHCRSSWLMEYGNLGYSDIRDGSRSWEEAAKTWEEAKADMNFKQNDAYQRAHGSGVIRRSPSHWRENYPGTMPPGDVYGAGSPLGSTFIEDDGLGEKYRGLYISCDMVRKEVMGYYPKAVDSQIDIGSSHPFVGLKAERKGEFFLPSDLVVGTDGSLFLSDFYNDSSRRTNQVSGTIYRISRKDSGQAALPKIDFSTIAGLTQALLNPNHNVRTVAVNQLKPHGDTALPAMQNIVADSTNPYHRARAIWVMAQLGPKAQAAALELLRHQDPQIRLVAWRALRFAQPEQVAARAIAMAKDTDPSVRREVALALRDTPYAECKAALSSLIAGYDGSNRWYLEAVGTACSGKERQVYTELVRPLAVGTAIEKWTNQLINLAWRLHTPEAMDDLSAVIAAQKPGIDRFRVLAMAYASYADEAERVVYLEKFEKLLTLPACAGPDYQATIQEIIAKDMLNLPGEPLNTDYRMPTAFGEKVAPTTTAEVIKLNGDAAKGRVLSQRCLVCHRIGNEGVAFGPALTEWGQNRTIEQIATEIINPSASLAHGYEDTIRLAGRGHVAEGIMSNYSYHAGSLKIKIFGGETKKILFRQSGAKIEKLPNHSWMPPAADMGLTAQDLRDIAEYLRKR